MNKRVCSTVSSTFRTSRRPSKTVSPDWEGPIRDVASEYLKKDQILRNGQHTTPESETNRFAMILLSFVAAPEATDRFDCMNESPGILTLTGTEIIPCQCVFVRSISSATAASSSISTSRNSDSDARVAACFITSYLEIRMGYRVACRSAEKGSRHRESANTTVLVARIK